MRTKLHPHSTSGFALRALLMLLLVFTGTEAAVGWQLCLGAEGHVEIERRGACEKPAHLPATTYDADECDPCRDVLLGGETDDALRTARSVVLPQETDAAAAMTATSLTAVPAADRRHASHVSNLLFDAGPPLGIRTVVLLI